MLYLSNVGILFGADKTYLVESSQFLIFESAQVECLYFSKKSGIEPLAIATQHNANKCRSTPSPIIACFVNRP